MKDCRANESKTRGQRSLYRWWNVRSGVDGSGRIAMVVEAFTQAAYHCIMVK